MDAEFEFSSAQSSQAHTGNSAKAFTVYEVRTLAEKYGNAQEFFAIDVACLWQQLL